MKWTAERVAWFVKYVPGHSEREISAEHERLFGVPLSESQIGNAKSRFHVKSGTHGGRFVKGQKSWNKGRHWSDFMPPESQERSRATCFKRGNLPHNALRNPIGTCTWTARTAMFGLRSPSTRRTRDPRTTTGGRSTTSCGRRRTACPCRRTR